MLIKKVIPYKELARLREQSGQGGVEPWGGFLGKTLRGQTEASHYA